MGRQARARAAPTAARALYRCRHIEACASGLAQHRARVSRASSRANRTSRSLERRRIGHGSSTSKSASKLAPVQSFLAPDERSQGELPAPGVYVESVCYKTNFVAEPRIV